MQHKQFLGPLKEHIVGIIVELIALEDYGLCTVCKVGQL